MTREWWLEEREEGEIPLEVSIWEENPDLKFLAFVVGVLIIVCVTIL